MPRSVEARGRKIIAGLERLRKELEQTYFEKSKRPPEAILDKLFELSLSSTYDWSESTRDTEDGTRRYYAELVELVRWQA